MRKKRVYKRNRKPDLKYSDVRVGRFINYVMEEGRKSIAQKVVYSAFDKVQKHLKKEPLEVFEKALANTTPQVEVVTKRVGGANYQVPRPVRPDRQFVLAAKWIIAAARLRKGKPMAERLAEELIAAHNNEGAAVKKKQDTHRMAEANRAFAHLAW